MNYLLTVKYPKQEVIEDGKESVTNVRENLEDVTVEELLEKYQNTGEDIFFEIEVSNEDPTSKAGRQTILYQGCNTDGGILSKFDAGAEYLDEEIKFTFEKFIIKNNFNILDGMI